MGVPTGPVATKAVAVETSEVPAVRGELVVEVRSVAASECRVDAVTRMVRLTRLRRGTERKRRNWLWRRGCFFDLWLVGIVVTRFGQICTFIICLFCFTILDV